MTSAAEVIEAMQRAVGHAAHHAPGVPFAIYIGPGEGAALLEHLSAQATVIADLTARLRVTEHERDTARAAVAGLIEHPDDKEP